MRRWCFGLWNRSREMSPYGPTLSCWTLSPDPMAWAPPSPKQPVPCKNYHQISSKKPNRAEVRVQRVQVISLGNLANNGAKGRDVHDAQTTVYTEARGCPFLHHVQTNNPGAWSEIGADPWVKNIVQVGTS